MIDNVNQDAIARGYMTDIGLPASYFADMGAIKKLRDQRAKAQAAQQKQQAALVQAKVAHDAGTGVGAAANAPMGQNSALDALLGGIGGSGQPGQGGQ